jgi:glycosyltransferase involved in cell wall biosynthesis
LKVLQVIKCLGYGGAERLLVDTVAAADPERVEYEVAYVNREQDELVPAMAALGTPVHPLGASNNADLRWMLALRKLVTKRRYDVVHFHLPYAAALGQVVLSSLPRSKRPGVVYTEHSLWDRARLVNRFVLRASLLRNERLIAVSQASYDALPAPLRRRATTVVHGVELSRADSLVADRDKMRSRVRSEVPMADDELLFMMVANLRPEKGYDVLLEAARAIADRGLPIRFAAVGRGPLSAELHTRRDALALGDRFHFLGQRGDVLELLAGADAFVLASRHEGLPVVLMEATSVGLPIVATSVGGVPQVLDDEVDAILVPPGDAGRLAGAIERLASDPQLRARLARNARRKSSQFDMAAAGRAIGDIYLQVVVAQ